MTETGKKFFPPLIPTGGKTRSNGMYIGAGIAALLVLIALAFFASHPATTTQTSPITAVNLQPQPAPNSIPGGVDIPIGATPITINGEEYYRFGNNMGDISKKDYLAHKAEFDAKLNGQAIGTVTPSQNSGQETTQTQVVTNDWYPISEKVFRNGGQNFQYNGINIAIKVNPIVNSESTGGVDIRIPLLEDRTKLQKSGKSIVVKMKFRIKKTGEIFTTPTSSYTGGQMFDAMPNWARTIGEQGKNLLPSDIEWQPEFGLKNTYND